MSTPIHLPRRLARGTQLRLQVPLPAGRDWSAVLLTAEMRSSAGRPVATAQPVTSPQDDGSEIRELVFSATATAALPPGSYTLRIRAEEVGVWGPDYSERIHIMVEEQ